jgi:acyl-CoA synthetase (AMP-forming)/AMP-acid ligase II
MQGLQFLHPSDGRLFTPATLVDVLRFRATHQGNQRAFSFLPDGETDSECLTFAELDNRARAVAVSLQTLTHPNEPVLLLFPQGLEFLVAFCGCLYAGRIAVPAGMPKSYRVDARIAAIAADAGASIALTTTMFGKAAGRHDLGVNLHPLDALDSERSTEWTPAPVSSSTLAFLQYTSGSTSVPKGVMVSHANVLYNSRYIHHDFQYEPTSVSITWLPHYHDMGLIEGLLQPLVHGFPGYLMPAVFFLQQPMKWLSAIARYGVTHSGAPNFAYDLCTRKITSEQAASLDLSSWRVAYNGAEPVRLETLRRFAQHFRESGFKPEALYPAYGLAEATLKVSGTFTGTELRALTVRSSALLQHRIEEAKQQESQTQTFMSCGAPTLATQVKIVCPETERECREHEVGEIWVSGPGVTQGYWNRSDESRKRFGASLGDGTRPRYLRTGDLGFMKSGELFVTGRLKDLIIVNGRNHYPGDIERTVEASSPIVRPGCTAAFSIDVLNEERVVVVAEIQRSDLRSWKQEGGETTQFDQAFRHIQAAVTEQHDLGMYCLVFIKPGTLPKTSSGKIQRSLCRERFLAGELHVVSQMGARMTGTPMVRQ